MTVPPLPYTPGPIAPPDKRYKAGNPTSAERIRAVKLGLKDAILQAAEDVGSDGKGLDGLAGYLRLVATSDVKAFCSLLGKVLPMQVSLDGKLEMIPIINVNAKPI